MRNKLRLHKHSIHKMEEAGSTGNGERGEGIEVEDEERGSGEDRKKGDG